MNRRDRLLVLLAFTCLLLPSAPLHAEPAPDPAPGATAPQGSAGNPPATPAPLAAVPASQPADAFSRLTVIVPKNQLPPLRSVRLRDPQETADRSRRGTISLRIQTQPKGARVLYGGKLLGETPLTLTAPRGSTPLDVTIRRAGYMTLHTRIMRKKSNTYAFKLTPAKFNEAPPAKASP